MRYGHQQKSEIDKWSVDEVLRYYERVYDLVKAESEAWGK